MTEHTDQVTGRGIGILLSAALVLALLLGASGPGEAVSYKGAWYKGDTHCHTDHSDGGLYQLADWLPRDVTIETWVETAIRRDIDWLQITDHRTLAQYFDVLHASTEVLLIPASEWGGRPHGVIWGMNEEIDIPHFSDFRRTQATAYLAHAQGALFTLSHPGDPGNGWWTKPGDDWYLTEGMDVIEVWNGGPWLISSGPNRDAIDFWEQTLNQGKYLTAVGASDIHFKQLEFAAGIGIPCTHVYARELSEPAILEAVKKGHVYVTNHPTNGPTVEFLADASGDGFFSYMMGDIISPSGPGEITLRVEVGNAPLATMKLFTNTGLLVSRSIDSSSFVFELKVPPTAAWYRVEIVREILGDATAALEQYRVLGESLAAVAYHQGNDDYRARAYTEALAQAQAGALIEELLAITNPIYVESNPNNPTATPYPTLTPSPTPLHHSGPLIMLGGYLDSSRSQTVTLVAYVDKSRLIGDCYLELSQNFVPQGLFLQDDGASGDFGRGDNLYGIQFAMPSGPGGRRLLLGVTASPAGTGRPHSWPWLRVY
jgi:hypothetical protein